jgi:hypothetical protein
MRIPADVRRFWQRIDTRTLRVQPDPGWHGPDFALTSCRMSRDEFPSAQPLALVQIAYTSHQCMSAELDVGDRAGGALFEWNVVDGDFVRRFNGIAEWLTYVQQLVEAGNARRRDTPYGRYLLVPDPDRWAEERETRPARRDTQRRGTARDATRSARAGDHRGYERLDGPIGLGIDDWPYVGPALQDLLEPGHADAAALERVRAVVSCEVEAGVRRLDLGDRELLDRGFDARTVWAGPDVSPSRR